MASRIYSSTQSPAHALHQWRQVGSNPEPSDVDRPEAKPPEPVAPSEEIFQLRLKEQCELAYRQGEAAGRNNAQAQLEEKFKALARAVENAGSYKVRLREEAERDVVSLALAIARRILRRQIQLDEEAILGLVKAAFENANLREVTQVRVHPNFADIVENHLRMIGAPVSIQLSGDASLELSGVMLETARGCLDASAETQLDEIGRGFADAVSLTGRAK